MRTGKHTRQSAGACTPLQQLPSPEPRPTALRRPPANTIAPPGRLRGAWSQPGRRPFPALLLRVKPFSVLLVSKALLFNTGVQAESCLQAGSVEMKKSWQRPTSSCPAQQAVYATCVGLTGCLPPG